MVPSRRSAPSISFPSGSTPQACGGPRFRRSIDASLFAAAEPVWMGAECTQPIYKLATQRALSADAPKRRCGQSADRRRDAGFALGVTLFHCSTHHCDECHRSKFKVGRDSSYSGDAKRGLTVPHTLSCSGVDDVRTPHGDVLFRFIGLDWEHGVYRCVCAR